MDGSQAIERYLDLVYKIARSIHRAIDRTVELDDLVSMGVEGLLEAVARADSQQRDRFVGYAFLRIRGAILDSLGHTAALPRKSHRLARAGRLVARSAPMDPKILDERPGRHLEIERAIDSRRAWRALAELPEDTRALFRAIYVDGRSLTDIADALGVSVSCVSRRHKRALEALREKLGEPQDL